MSQWPSQQELGLPWVLEELLDYDGGLVVVAGPRKSGVTTTLYWMLDWLNRNARTHIMTFEDPIEHQLYHKLCMTSQRQRDLNYKNLGEALQQSGKQGASFVMIGRLSEPADLQAASLTAFKGQLVLVGMEADSVEAVISQFHQTMGNAYWTTFCDSLKAICYQRLVRGLSGNSVLAAEVFLGKKAGKKVLFEKNWQGLQECMRTSERQGMQTFDRALYELVRQGKISAGEAIKQARDPEQLKQQLDRS